MSLKTGFGNSKQLGIASAMLLLLVLSWSSFAGAFSTTVETGGSQIHVFIEDTDFEMSDDQILQWIQRAGDIVTTYFGRFPGEKAYLAIMGQPGKGVGGGVALGGVDAVVNVRIGLDTDVADLRDDWVMVHELIHLAFPKMHRRHHWAEEGLSVYVESVARAQSEDIRAETMWSSFMDGMPKGLPRSGDRGLDHTPTWGRTYWGGGPVLSAGRH